MFECVPMVVFFAPCVHFVLLVIVGLISIVRLSVNSYFVYYNALLY